MQKPNRKSGKVVDKAVFKFFDKFISEDEEIRIKGAFDLISFLTSGTDGADKKEKERSYALKRLVRGVGSNSNDSRAGYSTALVGYLDQVKGSEYCPSITEIFNLVKTELSDTDKDDDDKQHAKLELRVGKVSICGAIIGSGLLETASDVELQTVLKTLKKGMYKMVTPLAIIYLTELVQKIDSKKFTKVLWPVFEPIMNVPKVEHTMETLHFLLAASTCHKKSVNQAFFENTFGSPQILHVQNYEYLANLLWDIKTTLTINHPFYDFFIEHLVKQGKVTEFWTHGVEPILQDENSEHKFKDIVALRVLITILNKLEDFKPIPELLSPSMMEMLIKKVKNFAQLSEDVRELYQEAFEALNQCYPKISDEECKLKIFGTLVSSPSSILIEKYAPNKVIQNLLVTMNGESVKNVASILKKLIVANDNAEALNSERIHAAQTLQKLLSNRHVLLEHEWRKEIVMFFLNLGVFYSSDGHKILKSSKNQSTAMSSELVPTMKSLFYHCLEYKHSKLTEEKTLLLSIVDHVHDVLQNKGNKSLRVALSEDHLQCWNRMYEITHCKEKHNKKLNNVFHILMMYMGLNMFSDPDLASSSVAELESVMKRVQNAKKASAKMEINQNGSNAEPEWIEVVVDLFLNLMSQNSHLLRKVIGHVFPHLSREMTLTAFNQILSVINLKDKTNPLSSVEQEDGERIKDEKMNTDEDDDEDDDDATGVDSEGDQSDAEKNQTESEDDDEDDDFTEDEDDEKVTDKMRMAIHAALGGANTETDTESVDLDSMNEEQGRKLDEALAEAFKMFKQSKKTKPTKAEERVETTLTHFRMRVFDLIDIYLKNGPNMIICLELMLYIFEMLPVAIKETKHRQILDRYRQIFNSLIKIKQFNVDVKDVSSDQLSEILTDLMEKVAKGSSFPEKNQYLLKACQFVVICSQLIEKNNSEGKQTGIDKVFCKYLKEFIADRNPPLNTNVFQTLFRMGWTGNWRLAKTLAENGLKTEVRTIRKTQTLQLLKDLLKNRRLIIVDPPSALKALKAVVNCITIYLGELSQSQTVSQNEFSELVQLLLELHNVQRQYTDLQSIAWKHVGSQIQKLRKLNLNSQTMSYYVRLCRQLQLEPIKNNKDKQQNGIAKTNTKSNGLTNGAKEADSDADETEEEKPTTNGTVKRKKNGNSSKQKRLKKEERLKVASQGLESVSFVNVE